MKFNATQTQAESMFSPIVVSKEVTESVAPDILDAFVSGVTEVMAYSDMLGIVVTIETHPLQPLAMGNYAMRCELRKARVMA